MGGLSSTDEFTLRRRLFAVGVVQLVLQMARLLKFVGDLPPPALISFIISLKRILPPLGTLDCNMGLAMAKSLS